MKEGLGCENMEYSSFNDLIKAILNKEPKLL
jgi:hypothetical protein